MNFKGKSVLITGASSGIGLELSKKLAKEECRIAILSRRIEKLEEIAAEHKTAANDILPVYCDVSKKADVEAAIGKVMENFGTIDIAILNAGTGARTGAEKFSSEEGERIMGVNLLGNIYFLEKLLPYFIKKRGGTIAGISSLADARGFPLSGIYNASKAGFTTLLESLRIELKEWGIKIITIRPGFVKTAITDKNEFYMPFLMSAEKAAVIIIKELKKEKSRINFPLRTAIGTKIIELFPNGLFEYLAGKHLQELIRKKL